MTEEVEEKPKKRGRPKGTKVTPKIKLKHNPKTALEDYVKLYKDNPVCVVYGLDEYTTLLIDKLWNNPEIIFHVTDPNEDVLANTNRKFAQRSMSMYRWNVHTIRGFIELPVDLMMVVSSKYIEEVRKVDNPENVTFIVMEDL